MPTEVDGQQQVEGRETVFVLKEALASEKRGKPVWFRFMTVIGPCSTQDIEERAEFPSLEAALRSPAVLHSLTFYEPVEVDHGC